MPRTRSGAPRDRVPDVGAGAWSMPWKARDGVGRLGPGSPKSDFWASAKEGIDQVGCVYTAQGFEFNVRRGVTEAEFTRYVKSTYRVLLTRGLRGC